jgi:CRISPR type III-B/RAMP module-associated protein Cmr3
MPVYHIVPNDVLFFRDARPMTAGEGSGGHGAHWPHPGIFFSAVHSALYRAYGDRRLEGEHQHRAGRNGQYGDESTRSKRFGSLSTVGPFPVKTGQWLFPTPGDVTSDAMRGRATLLPIPMASGTSDLPQPLTHGLGSTVMPSKDLAQPWRSKAALESYLCDKESLSGAFRDGDVMSAEWNTGIGIDPERGVQDGEHIYSAEYLRLQQDVSLGTHASMPLKERDGAEGMKALFTAEGRVLVMGGQQRACNVEERGTMLDQCLPVGPMVKGMRVKWVLLSPAVFPAIEADSGRGILPHPGGWLPNWVDSASGQVLLKKGDTERKINESRESWRQRVRGFASFDCKLVAARISGSVAISGWSLESDGNGGQIGAKSTLLAVPAGSVYFFEGPDATGLADALNWHGSSRANVKAVTNRRSALLGEQGFGLGVCGGWTGMA